MQTIPHTVSTGNVFETMNCQLCYPGFEERSRVLTAPYLCRIQIDTSHHVKALKLAPNGVSQSDNMTINTKVDFCGWLAIGRH